MAGSFGTFSVVSLNRVIVDIGFAAAEPESAIRIRTAPCLCHVIRLSAGASASGPSGTLCLHSNYDSILTYNCIDLIIKPNARAVFE
jgi:hypothetical protein